MTLVKSFGEYDDSRHLMGGPFAGNGLWEHFNDTMLMRSHEYHRFRFSRNRNPGERVAVFFRKSSHAGFVDALDLAVAMVHSYASALHREYAPGELRQNGVLLNPESALQQIDGLLRTNGTMFRIADGRVVVSTDDFTHEEAIVPALLALAEPGFENALREFHGALDDQRKDEGADALTKANHAFESTMKVIAAKSGWSYNETDQAKTLVAVMISNGLVPPMREPALNGLRMMLDSDVTTLRNKMPSAGHGAGTRPPAIPQPFVTYALNAAASNIRFLIEMHRLKRRR